MLSSYFPPAWTIGRLFCLFFKDAGLPDADAASLAAVNPLRLVGPHGTDAGHFHAKRVFAPRFAGRNDADGRFGVFAVIIHERGIYRISLGI